MVAHLMVSIFFNLTMVNHGSVTFMGIGKIKYKTVKLCLDF